ncbi:MAG: SDR family oxidoreductase [Betaproteobacteria bacterium]|nr:SDR family oxidoreductase [Betaproteobacteria bacterium]
MGPGPLQRLNRTALAPPGRAAEAPRIFITGASAGIGAALARQYAREGAVLGLFARRANLLDALAAELSPASVATYAGDVRHPEALARAATDFLTRFGAPDIVIANAGISYGTLTECPEDRAAFAEIFAVNVLGLVHTFQPFLHAMRDRGEGCLAGVASVAGFRGLPGAGAYSASKAAAITYLESLRVELRGSGVSVHTICPGYVDTAMTRSNPYAMPFLLSADQAARRIARSLRGGQSFQVLPWQMAVVGWFLRRLPNPVYDRLFAHAPRKPRLVE